METEEKTTEPPEDIQEEKKQKVSSRISLWVSIFLSTAAVVGYYLNNPPDSEEVRRMRMFFKENIIAVTQFINMPRNEQAQFAARQKHPFYKNYQKASEIERERLRALIHLSTDYTPNQYWVNIIFLWFICFTSVWFIGVMTEGALILMRRKKAGRS